jgi:Zn-dependent M28 family amino/carboxypeptidase
VRWKALKAAGAVGEISISNPRHMESPWERRARARTIPSMSLADPALDELAGERLGLGVNPARAEKFFAGGPHTFAEIVDRAERREPLPRFALPLAIRTRIREETAPAESFNVAGVIRGSDPSLAKEYVVLSAHLDHLGIGPPIAGDPIYNGAMDNASGCAALLDFAQEQRASGTRLKRSVLLLFVTAEEKGLLGSRWYAVHPTVPRDAMVADLNIDMFLPLFPLRLVTVLGLDESDLGQEIRVAARRLGISVQRDPEPERHVFIRSDQYNFVREGVPAVMVDVAAPAGTPEAALLKKWLFERYHAPSDDGNQPVDRDAATAYEKLMFGAARSVANRPDRPQWKPESFFRRFARR